MLQPYYVGLIIILFTRSRPPTMQLLINRNFAPHCGKGVRQDMSIYEQEVINLNLNVASGIMSLI